MQSIKDNRLETLGVRGQTIRLLTKLHYLAGKHANAAGVHPDLYKELRSNVVVQGTRSSNDIEGITLPLERYKPLILGNAEPTGRKEKLIVGYRDTLAFIHKEWPNISVTPETVKDLHRRMHAHVSESTGSFRDENVLIERDEGGETTIVYTPPPHQRVEDMMLELCRSYGRLHNAPHTDEFMLMAGFILDFTCIHPFKDGNGRISRLLTTLLAYKAGFEIVRYISHEKLVSDSKREYYAALTNSSENWLRGNHKWTSWIDYLASTFKNAYEELASRVEEAGNEKGYQSRRIREVIGQLPTKFTIRHIFDMLPTATRPTVNRVLADMRSSGEIKTVGAGPKAHYRKVSVMDK